MRLIVYHARYGCETGCCGHFVEVAGFDPDDVGFEHRDGWTFEHADIAKREFAEELIRKTFGADHIKDLDWENSRVVTFRECDS